MTEGIPVYADHRQIPAFHPIRHREEGAWYPSNEAADLLVHVGHIWDDIVMLDRIRRERSDGTEKRLLFKYIVVELWSALESPLLRLQAIIMTARVRRAGEARPWRSISSEERAQAKVLFKNYHAARRKLERDVREIRNRIGAHRRLQPWDDVISLWDRLEPSRFREILNTIPAIFNFAQELDLYDWARTTEEGHVQILGPRIDPGGIST